MIIVSEVPEADYWNFFIHTMNWLESGDMANRQVSLSGHIYRWVWSKTNPQPVGRVVKVDKVRSMLPELHPVIDGKERNKRLALRREHYWNRYL